ncbi:unnamed protein product, partial [Sphagnum compactum]
MFWTDRVLDKARIWLERAVQAGPEIGDVWAWFLAFERKHGDKIGQMQIVERCERAGARIPPRMTPQNLRQLLGVIGEVGRVYLVPRKQNKGRKEFGQGGFEEGWVEFLNRKDAKRAAVSLNCYSN